MTTWVYRFTGNAHFPEPVHEIAALAALDEECEGAWLMLSARADPPGKGAAPGDEFLLCADAGNGLRLYAVPSSVARSSFGLSRPRRFARYTREI